MEHLKICLVYDAFFLVDYYQDELHLWETQPSSQTHAITRCLESSARTSKVMTTDMAPHTEMIAGPEVTLQALGRELTASIWEAVHELRQIKEFHALDNKTAVSKLHCEIQKRLLVSHAPLLIMMSHAPLERKRDRTETTQKKATRVWRPTRPALAQKAAQLIADGIGLVSVPNEKRSACTLPMKIFCREVAAKLGTSDIAANTKKSSLTYAVSEVLSAISNEADELKMANNLAGIIELHRSTDAPWKGSDARGCGIAINDNGKDIAIEAARRVAEKLSQPALKVRRSRG